MRAPVDEVHEVHGAVVLQHGALGPTRAARGEDDVAHVACVGAPAWQRGRLRCKRVAILIDLRARQRLSALLSARSPAGRCPASAPRCMLALLNGTGEHHDHSRLGLQIARGNHLPPAQQHRCLRADATLLDTGPRMRQSTRGRRPRARTSESSMIIARRSAG